MFKTLQIFFLFVAFLKMSAAQTNYVCMVCGKDPIVGGIWPYKRGHVCDNCHNLPNHCSICGLPIRDGNGAAKTTDGRFICKFCKPECVFDMDENRKIVASVSREMVKLFGQGFELKFPDVSVNMYDVERWSKEKTIGAEFVGHAFTAHLQDGRLVHQIVLKYGESRVNLTNAAAHEYTHLWINENRPQPHLIDNDTIEAICDLSTYKLMESRANQYEMNRVLENPYTNGKIKRLVEVEKEKGMAFILDWVKNKLAPDFDTPEPSIAKIPPTKMTSTNASPQLPEELKYTGGFEIGATRSAIINGVAFVVGDVKPIRLRNKTVQVCCLEIGVGEVRLKVDDKVAVLILKSSKSK